MVSPRGGMLTAEPGEVADVLGKQGVSAVRCGRQNVSIWPARHPDLRHRNGVEAVIPQCLRQLAGVHFVEEKPHWSSAAAVS